MTDNRSNEEKCKDGPWVCAHCLRPITTREEGAEHFKVHEPWVALDEASGGALARARAREWGWPFR